MDTKSTDAKNDVDTVRQRLAQAVQDVAQRVTDPSIRVEVDANGSFRIADAPGHGILPGTVRASCNRGYSRTPGNEVHICVLRHYRTVYSKTCVTWTDERLAEVAEVIWNTHQIEAQAEAKARADKADLRRLVPIAAAINQDFVLSGALESSPHVVAMPDGLHLEGSLTEDEARAVLHLLAERWKAQP